MLLNLSKYTKFQLLGTTTSNIERKKKETEVFANLKKTLKVIKHRKIFFTPSKMNQSQHLL